MNKFNNSKIYLIKAKNIPDSLIYIGYTTLPLNKRFSIHKSHYNEYKNNKRRLTTSFLLFQKYGIENCIIELIKLVNVNTLQHIKQIEMHYINSMECVNKQRFLSYHEYYINNIDKIKEKNKIYKENNKDKIIENRKSISKEKRHQYYINYKNKHNQVI
jgi:hypothetical protein